MAAAGAPMSMSSCEKEGALTPTSSPVSIRPTRSDDFEAVHAMMGDFARLHHGWRPDLFRPEPFALTAALFQSMIEEEDTLDLTAELGGTVAGYAAARRWSGVGGHFMWAHRGVYITFIVVAPDARRRGAGRALFEAVEDWAEGYGAQYIGLHVDAGNEAAKAFYTSLGYHVDGEARHKPLRRNRRALEIG
jgi:ribosomal protein S18 acetylase RimI-like enzyme